MNRRITGTVRTRTNNRVDLNGNALEIVKPGTYKVDGSFVISATAVDNVITLPVSAVIQAAPAAPGNKVALTWVTSAAGTLISASETVSRIV